MKPICIDANVFIALTKGDEKYSSDQGSYAKFK
jgi:predicted nucleic acid-binding protein